MAYKRKTRDRWDIMVDYGYGDGWECEFSTYDRKEARQTLKSYRENASTKCNVKLEKHREKISETK